MIETIEQLKEQRPDLVEQFDGMTKDQLLNQCYLECIDALNMEEIVSVFMEYCTVNISKTNYTPYTLKNLIIEKHEREAEEWEKYLKTIRKKADKWDKLDKEIGDFYQDQESELGLDPEECGDLTDIGEAAARAFGYL